MKYILTLSAAVVLSICPFDAFASDNSAFVRVEAGIAKDDLCCFNDHMPAYSFRGGYFFNANFGVEGFYTRLGEASDNFLTLKGEEYGIGIVGKKSFGDEPHTGAFVSGRIGYARTTIDSALKNTELDAVALRFEDSSSRAYVGIGAGYDFNRNLGLSLNFDIPAKNFGDVFLKLNRTYTLGLEYRF